MAGRVRNPLFQGNNRQAFPARGFASGLAVWCNSGNFR